MTIVLSGPPDPTDVVFRDPLSDVTRKVRTQLLLVAALAVLVKVYDLRLNKTPWLDIDVPSTAPHILDGILSVSVAYLFFAFLVYAVQDFRRWRGSGKTFLVKGSFNLILKSRNSLHVIEQHIGKLTSGNPVDEKIRTAVSEAADALPKAQEEIRKLQANLITLGRLQWFRLIVIELGVPVVLGAVAFGKTCGAVVPFISSVFQ